jgi:hypothetical protein
MALSIPYTVESFDSSMQNRFKESIAAAAEVSVADVTIDKISPARRRLMAGRKLLADGIRVDVSVKAKDNNVATQMASKLTEDKINSELQKRDLEAATMMEAPAVKTLDTAASDGLGSGEIAAIVSGVLVLVGALAVYVVRSSYGNVEPSSSKEPAVTMKSEVVTTTASSGPVIANSGVPAPAQLSRVV